LGVLFTYAYTLYRSMTKFDVVTHMGTELGFRGNPRLTQLAGLQRSPILGLCLIYALTISRKTTKFDVVA